MRNFQFLAVLAVCGSLAAQTDQPVTTMSVKVKVVNVLATVRDKHGTVIGNLNKDDFTLSEDGRPQSIHYFAQESDLPLTLGLLVDTSLSQRRVLDQERSASHSFLDRMVREDRDRAFIIHFDHEVELLQDLTSSHEKLEGALGGLETPRLQRANAPDPSSPDPSDPSDPSQRGGGGRRGGHGGGFHGGGTMLYDAVYLASDEVMKKQQGRKAVIILSDGVDTGSKETLEYAMETAQRADTVVYSILFKDDEQGGGGGFSGPRMGGGIGGTGGGMGRGGRGGRGGYPQQRPHEDGKKVLQRISKETGGRLFEVSKKENVDQIYAQIEDELRHQYNLGYTPDRGTGIESGYHKIQLAVKKKDMVAQTREGYYGSE
ncbi:MAG TPA: VWA domain-containing protein [Terriglobales bacterium]|jgi:VWFA-related protein|nr:VWA domain-containing protein [Terriglobales bacterium]